MPLYEGLSSMSFITEKHTSVIFDFGKSLTKIGFVGESSPRAIIKSEVTCRKTGETVPVFKFDDKKELSEHLVDFIYIIYFKYLLVNPKDRRVVIVENILGPSIIKNTLTDTFFKHYEVSSLLFLPSHLVCLMTLGITSATVIDLGYEEATVLPIYKGIPILKAWKASPLGSKAILNCLKQLLLERALCKEGNDEEKRLETLNIDLTEKILEDIKVRCCFVSPISRSKKLQLNMHDRSIEPPPPPPSLQYNLKGSHIMSIPGTIFEMASEVLFELDDDKINIPSIIFESILECPIDTRKLLSQNLVIIGGISSMSGMKNRIVSELREMVSNAQDEKNLYTFKVHQPPIADNCVGWLGGAIYGCTEATPIHSTSREAYFETGRIYDWSNLLFNTKTEYSNI